MTTVKGKPKNKKNKAASASAGSVRTAGSSELHKPNAAQPAYQPSPQPVAADRKQPGSAVQTSATAGSAPLHAHRPADVRGLSPCSPQASISQARSAAADAKLPVVSSDLETATSEAADSKRAAQFVDADEFPPRSEVLEQGRPAAFEPS